MKSIFLILKNLKAILPYFLFIAIYFYFISIEASKDIDTINENELTEIETNLEDKQLRIKIPVIPYNK
tara:strand:+ start:304 stop:507 length:204 start_codon:yes stop_codon:yes gene_type:complete